MTTEISVMYGSEKVKDTLTLDFAILNWSLSYHAPSMHQAKFFLNKGSSATTFCFCECKNNMRGVSNLSNERS